MKTTIFTLTKRLEKRRAELEEFVPVAFLLGLAMLSVLIWPGAGHETKTLVGLLMICLLLRCGWAWFQVRKEIAQLEQELSIETQNLIARCSIKGVKMNF